MDEEGVDEDGVEELSPSQVLVFRLYWELPRLSVLTTLPSFHKVRVAFTV